MKTIIKTTFLTLEIFISIYFLILISNLNILPNKYYYLVLIIMVLLNLATILLTLNKKLWILGVILSVIPILISIFGIKYLKVTEDYLNKKFNNNVNVSVYNVLVLNNDNYKTIDDLENKNMGYLKSDLDKNNYLDKIDINIEYKEYNNPYVLYEELLNKNIESLIINEAYMDLLEDQYQDLSSKTKVIYKFDINETTKKTEDIKKLDSINILISGSDSRTNYVPNKSRTDVNMIMTINPNTKTILLTSIPRDYYVRLHGTQGLKDKLTHSGIYGIEMTKKTLEDLFDIKIDYMIKVGFQSVINLVDLVGGIDIDSDASFYSHCNDGGAKSVYVKKGMNHFNGAEALSYARERYAYETGDRHRILNQQQVLEAVMIKVFKDKSLLTRYEELLDAFGNFYITDIPASFIKLLVKDQINDMKSWNIIHQSVDGMGDSQETYSMPGMKLYVMQPDYETVTRATKKINEVKENIE